MTIRAALYSRVSSEMQLAGHSLDAQRRALRDACTARGYEIVVEETDEALSARGEKIEARPGLSRLLDAVDAGRVDVLAVHSLDRLSRNILVTLRVFQRLAARQVAFVSLSEAIDYSTPEGRLQLTILGAFAAYFSDNLAKHVSKGKGERVAQGRHNNQPPFGYCRDAAGAVILDPVTVDVAREMWRLAAAGHTDRQVAEALAPLGHVMSRDTVRSILTNRFFAGEVRHRDAWRPGQQPALVDAATFATVQALRQAHRRTMAGPHRRNPQRGDYTLGGLLTCARCGQHLHINASGRQYVCWGRRGYQCDQPIANDATLVAQMGEILGRLALPEAAISEIVQAQSLARPVVDTSAVERTMDRLRRMYAWGHLDEAEYMRQYDACTATLRQAAERVTVDDALAAMSRLRDLAGLWQDAQPAERQTIASAIIADLLIDDRRIVALRPQEAWRPVIAAVLSPHGRAGYRAV